MVDGGNSNAQSGLPDTRWSLVMRAAGGAAVTDEDRRKALGEIFHRYQPAMRSYLLARGIRPERADDLVQSFVADKMLEKNLLARADQSRGGFRAFLFTSLNNHCMNESRRDRSRIRSPESGKLLPIDDPCVQIGAAPDTDMFDIAWARETMAEALRRMQEGCIADGRSDLWEVFEVRLLAPAVDDVPPLPYEDFITAKRRAAQALRSVLAEYVTSEAQLEEELKSLGEILARASRG
jgi:DNA-directed RNA polymerase specialized sigma24 family protein